MRAWILLALLAGGCGSLGPLPTPEHAQAQAVELRKDLTQIKADTAEAKADVSNARMALERLDRPTARLDAAWRRWVKALSGADRLVTVYDRAAQGEEAALLAVRELDAGAAELAIDMLRSAGAELRRAVADAEGVAHATRDLVSGRDGGGPPAGAGPPPRTEEGGAVPSAD